MDEILQAQFDRVEQALSTLVDSIASYNPNPQAAIDLVAADDELSHGLDQLARHQANHARLQTLRAEADTLEAQLKSSVAALAALRKELSDTPATVFPATSRPVPFDALLQYAKSISKYTVPPTFRERITSTDDDDTTTDKDKASANEPLDAPATTTALNTPTAPTSTFEALTSTLEAPTSPSDPTAPAAPTAPDLTLADEEWLLKLKANNFTWFPWPDADKIRRGNLWKLYHYREQGRDLAAFDIEAYEADERRKFEDDAVPEQGEGVGVAGVPVVEGAAATAATAVVPAVVPAVGAGAGVGVGVGVQGPATAAKGAGFTLFDDMESDED